MAINDIRIKLMEKFGPEKQMLKTCEEMSELIKEIIKYINGEGDSGRIKEEYYDVLYTLFYVQDFFLFPYSEGRSEIEKRDEKCKKLLEKSNEIT